ncbi:MAG: peptide-methionine (S)-S-oxide reductase MsrA [Pyrinomonadaceae bacterium]|nr:peptide-methionine (S)-S-oxide reductase MsrA [Pyrinomonadaceae bacterium]
MTSNNLETATLGGGCFWCTESVFDSVIGVEEVVSGYSGGHKENPTYEEVCSDSTGHAEVIQIKFDPETISYEEILEIFFGTHDPTTLNRQGNDIGSSYRSAIFYHSPQQKEIAEKVIKTLTDDDVFGKPIVTEVTELSNFYPAESYHQNYFANNPNQPYCAAVVAPKLGKFRQKFADKLKV